MDKTSVNGTSVLLLLLLLCLLLALFTAPSFARKHYPPTQIPVLTSWIHVPLTLHIVHSDSPSYNSLKNFTPQVVTSIMSQTQEIWDQARIRFDYTIKYTFIPATVLEPLFNQLDFYPFQVWLDSTLGQEPTHVHGFFLKSLATSLHGRDYPFENVFFISETSYGAKVGESLSRVVAHELGHVNQLVHPPMKVCRNAHSGRLMCQNQSGTSLTPREIAVARSTALTKEQYKRTRG